MKDKVKFLIIGIALIVVVIMTGTFAWLSYQSNKTAMVLTIGDINNAQVTLQPYQINASIVPRASFSATDTNNKVVNVEAVNNANVNKKVRLYYRINEIDEELISEDFQYVITRQTETNGSYNSYKTGDFSEAESGTDYEILNEEVPEDKTYNYKVYLWLNGAESENTQGSSFNGELRAEINTNYMKADNDTGNANSDVFDSGILRTSIEKVTFQNTIPSNITASDQPIDISLNGDNSVIAYFKEGSSSGMYDMYIAANGMIIATDLTRLFNYYTNVTQIQNTNYIDTSQVTSMVATFQYCSKLTSLDVTSWDTSNVVNMSGMFGSSVKLTSLNLSNFDTSKVTSMYGMFLGYSTFGNMALQTIVGIEDFVTSNVTDMRALFQNCSNLTSLDLSEWDTSKVTTMQNMFYGCSNLSSLDLSNWNTSKLTSTQSMFSRCSNLATIYVSDSWNVLNVTNSNYMFSECSSLPNYNASVIDKTNAHYSSGGYLTLKS